MNDISPNMHTLFHLILFAVSQLITILTALTFFLTVFKMFSECGCIPWYSIVPSQFHQVRWLMQIVYYSFHAVFFLQLSNVDYLQNRFFNFNQCNREKIHKVYRNTPVFICSNSHWDLFFFAIVFGKKHQAVSN